MFIVLEWNIFSSFFFNLIEKNIPSKSDEHGWVFFSPQKKNKLKKIPKHVCGTCVDLYPY